MVDADGGDMILVTGSILAREENFDDVLLSCLEHVEEAFDCRSDRDCTAMLAALAIRLR